MDYIEYCQSVLMMQDSEVQAACGAAVMPVLRKMKLSHVVDVLDWLENSSEDIFERVMLQFKDELKDTTRKQLTAAAKKMNLDMLLPPLKNFVLNKIAKADEYNLKPDAAAKDWLGAEQCTSSEDDLSELQWYEDHFPADLELRY